eukprot:TRINITY_DN48_c0_g1_i1.p1 TRINITY_DN48_c0_g1~~TRINITY_DN48_c0_g1_i1.p1  ORF type:complete len:204 (-),score=69.56 TRINITY_DN48_c0_g1_i1:193-804(-)
MAYRVLVACKHAIDLSTVKIRIKPDKLGVVTQGVKMGIAYFDELAVEEALRLKEKGVASEVIAVSVGPADAQKTLRHALAMGADSAVHVNTGDVELAPLQVAKALREIVREVEPQLVLTGKQATDGDYSQTGQMLAGMLDWPQATQAAELNVENDSVKVVRETDAGLETISMNIPAVVTAGLRLNEARLVKMPNIMKAKKEEN